eukprot:363545-Chlamydomonas_euryale.AAC.3
MALHIGLDIGTQSTKAVVWDSRSHRVVSRGACAYEPLRCASRPGRAEQHVGTWTDAAASAVRSALAGLDRGDSGGGDARGGVRGELAASAVSRVVSLGVSGQQHGMVLLGRSGEALRPAKLWCDTESAREADELGAASGVPMVPAFTASKLLWTKRHEADVFDAATSLLLPASYVGYWLTGERGMDAGDASGTGLLDVSARAWDGAAATRVDARARGMLPPLLAPSERLGYVRDGPLQAMGLLHGQRVVVSAGSGDNACAALGAGVIRDGQVWGAGSGESHRVVVLREGRAVACDGARDVRGRSPMTVQTAIHTAVMR